jgi:pyroglutamyl-peptidase
MQAAPRCLVTGFEPFEGDAINTSWEVARALHGQRLHGADLVAEQLPCTFDGAIPALRAALRRHRPQLVLALGQAGRSVISLERVAINVIDARIPDNAGAQPIDVPVQAGAPAAHFGTLPIKAMLAALRRAGIGAEVSQSAGTFVCNQVFYGLMQALRRRPGVRGGFVHVPLLPAQAAARGLGQGMPLDQQISGVRLALATALRTRVDRKLGAGRLD